MRMAANRCGEPTGPICAQVPRSSTFVANYTADMGCAFFQAVERRRESTRVAAKGYKGHPLAPGGTLTITYRSLSHTPVVFRNLCGLSVPEFDALCRV